MYDSFSQDYDRFVNWNNRLGLEIPFLVEKIKATITKPVAKIRVLDAAAGTGMHAITLAREGFVTAGVDLSQGMVDAARENAQKHGVRVPFATAGFGEIARILADQRKITQNAQLAQLLPFDVVLCLGNSLPHVDDRTALDRALQDFAECLAPGGLLIVQNRNFDAILSAQERWMEPQTLSDEGQEYIFLRFYDFLPDGRIQFNILTLKRDREKEWRQSILTTRLYPLTRAILLEALKGAGFQRITEFGALANSPFQVEKSGNLVITAIEPG